MGKIPGRPVKLIVTPGDPEPVPLPPGSPWTSMQMSDALAWVYCDCPWWHYLPFVGRRVHSDLP